MWALDKLGLRNEHMYSRFAGVPDRYVVGGNWLEFKSIAYVRFVNVLNHFEPEQKRRLREWHAAADRAFGVVLLKSEYENHLLIAPWPVLSQATKVTFEWARDHLPEIKDKHDVLRAMGQWFSRDYDRYSKYDYQAEA